MLTTWSASENSSLFGTLNQHWLDSFYPGFGTGNYNEACSPASMTNAAVYLQNLDPQLYGNSLITPAPANINYNGQSFTTDDNWIYTAGGVVANASNMNTNVNGTWDFNFLNGAYNYLESRAPGQFTYTAMTGGLGWGYPPTPLANPPYLGVVQNQVPTWNYLLQGLQYDWSVQICLEYSGEYGGGHTVTLTEHFV